MKLLSSALALAMLAPSLAAAQTVDDKVLFIEWGGNYTADGNRAYAELQRLTDNTVYVNIRSNPGGAAAAIAQADADGEPFDQVWSYDLSSTGDNFPTDIQAIAAWYANESGGHVIADGRFLGSFRSNTATGEGRLVATNYYTNLMEIGGGIVLATDHNSFANGGTNILADAMGIGPFTGNFSNVLGYDATSVLFTNPTQITFLSNNTTTGQAPVGTLPNGLVLTPIAYHSGNTATPAVSSTFGSSFNLDVSIDEPTDNYLLCPPDDGVTATASVEGEVGTVTYSWISTLDGSLGTGSSIELEAASLSEGTHEIRVVAEDQFIADGASITVQVGGDLCDDDGDGVLNGDDQCEGFDDALDADGDDVPNDCDPCFGELNDADADDDGVCDDEDACAGDDAQPDTDGDGICEDIDQCTGDDAQPDTDGDGICEDIDECTGDDATGDADGDGICGDTDLCIGDDSTFDLDGDGYCGDLDCRPDDEDAYPGADELCNGLDDDCDDDVPANEADEDGDTFRICDDDCDDTVATIYDGAPELCDELDNNCDGTTDEGFEDTNDDDVLDCLEDDLDGDGFTPSEGDCDDTNADTYDGAIELCDGLDNDCNGVVPAEELDSDDDGFSECEGDCAPDDDRVGPNAIEVCDGLDNDCDGELGDDEVDNDDDGVLACDDSCDEDPDISTGECQDALGDDTPFVAGGCNCNAAPTAPVGALLPLMVGGLLLRRRRSSVS